MVGRKNCELAAQVLFVRRERGIDKGSSSGGSSICYECIQNSREHLHRYSVSNCKILAEQQHGEKGHSLGKMGEVKPSQGEGRAGIQKLCKL